MNSNTSAAPAATPWVVVLAVGPGQEGLLAEILDAIDPQAPVALVLSAASAPRLAERWRARSPHDGEPLAVQHAYVVPFDRDVEVRDGTWVVSSSDRGGMPFDRLFTSVARSTAGQCACVVLAGEGDDAVLGSKLAKQLGALVVAVDPSGVSQPALPRAVLATGRVDIMLPAARIGARLTEIARSVAQSRDAGAAEKSSDALRNILVYVRVRSGHDFTSYKRATLLRRIARRMQVRQVETLEAYLTCLREIPLELPALLRDFMISVTSFFRDPETFDVVARAALQGKVSDAQTGGLRLWVAGCATGEEAYSYAMLCVEHHMPSGSVQIFATDIDEEALATARAGLYPFSIDAEVSPERLQRFFVREPHGYRVQKELREMVLFSPHNLLRDPPFSRLDLVSCRNVLIYLDREAQERVLSVMHFALRPDGCLVLGSSESAEGLSALFAALDPKHRLYSRRPSPIASGFTASLPTARWSPTQLGAAPAPSERAMPYGELHYKLLELVAPPSVLVDDQLEIVHLSESAGRYLTLAGGEPTRSLVRLAPEALRLDLRAAIYGAQQSETGTDARVVETMIDGAPRRITLRVRAVPLPDPSRRMMLVTFEERREQEAEPPIERAPSVAVEPVVRRMEDELRRTRDHLRLTIEQYETSVEELKASNEELHAINEELRSATEERETSQEELQSVNEELTTLNHELKDRVEEVSRARADLQNLMASTEIGVVFLDRQMLIKGFTPRAADVLSILPSDVGRPLSHLTHQLIGFDLAAEPIAVLQSLHMLEREVRSRDGRRYLVRILPYRSMEDHIEGVVLTFLDITALKRAEDDLVRRGDMMRLAERATNVGFWEIDGATQRFTSSAEYQRLVGLSAHQASVSVEAWLARVDAGDRARIAALLDKARADGGAIEFEICVPHADGARWLWHSGRADEGASGGRSLGGLAIDVTNKVRLAPR